MKKHWILLLALALTAALLTGCRRNTVPMIPTNTTAPLNTVRPTAPRTEPTVIPRPTETATAPIPSVPESTIEDGNGPIRSQTEPQKF